MQLTSYTDYALRTLIVLGLCAPDKMTAHEIGDAYGISVNHLVKVIQRLSALGYVQTVRGKAGGVRLAMQPRAIKLGDVVRNVESDLGVVACLRSTSTESCSIAPSCRLKGILGAATNEFLRVLDGHTLADILEPRTKLVQLLAKPQLDQARPRNADSKGSVAEARLT